MGGLNLTFQSKCGLFACSLLMAVLCIAIFVLRLHGQQFKNIGTESPGKIPGSGSGSGSGGGNGNRSLPGKNGEREIGLPRPKVNATIERINTSTQFKIRIKVADENTTKINASDVNIKKSTPLQDQNQNPNHYKNQNSNFTSQTINKNEMSNPSLIENQNHEHDLNQTPLNNTDEMQNKNQTEPELSTLKTSINETQDQNIIQTTEIPNQIETPPEIKETTTETVLTTNTNALPLSNEESYNELDSQTPENSEGANEISTETKLQNYSPKADNKSEQDLNVFSTRPVEKESPVILSLLLTSESPVLSTPIESTKLNTTVTQSNPSYSTMTMSTSVSSESTTLSSTSVALATNSNEIESEKEVQVGNRPSINRPLGQSSGSVGVEEYGTENGGGRGTETGYGSGSGENTGADGASDSPSNPNGPRNEIIRRPRLTVYAFNNFGGPSETFELASGKCTTLPEDWHKRISSLKTHGYCIEVCQFRNCIGRCFPMAPGAPGHNRLRDINFDKRIASMRCCLSYAK